MNVSEKVNPACIVSVCMITYNHERFIEQAINSVVMQRTKFGIELVVNDDCSTDRTPEILQRLSARYPWLIRLQLSQANVGMQRNFSNALERCQGRYVALLEGDDYWLDSNKLERQVQFLTDHEECSVCCHSVFRRLEGESVIGVLPRIVRPRSRITLSDIVIDKRIGTGSIMLRKELVPKLPDWVHQLPCVDWPLMVICAEHGMIGGLHEPMGVWRIHGGGAWSGLTDEGRLNMVADTREGIAQYVKAKYGARIERAANISVGKKYIGLATHLESQGRHSEAALLILKFLGRAMRELWVPTQWRAALAILFPKLARIRRAVRRTRRVT